MRNLAVFPRKISFTLRQKGRDREKPSDERSLLRWGDSQTIEEAAWEPRGGGARIDQRLDTRKPGASRIPDPNLDPEGSRPPAG